MFMTVQNTSEYAVQSLMLILEDEREIKEAKVLNGNRLTHPIAEWLKGIIGLALAKRTH